MHFVEFMKEKSSEPFANGNIFDNGGSRGLGLDNGRDTEKPRPKH